MEPVEPGCLKLLESARDHPAPWFKVTLESVAQLHVQTVHQQVTATEGDGIGGQVVEIQADRGIVRRDDGAGADADDRIDRDAMLHQLPNHADVSRATQTAGAQDETDSNRSCRSR